MYAIEPSGRGRGRIPRPFLLPLGVLMFLAAASHAVFPFFPLLFVALLFAARGPRGMVSSAIGKKKEILRALERRGELTAARAALETSLGEAEEMLSRLANEGHLRASAKEGRLVYALWE